MSDDFPRAAVRDALVSGLEEQALQADAPVDALIDYLALLHRWNRAFNLSAVRDPLEMVHRHIMDSLAVLPYVDGSRLLDVGSGPGLPGIPLALVRPDIAVTLLDSNGKKTRFLRQAATELGLADVEIVHERTERWSVTPGFDTIISRAYARLDTFVDQAGRLLAPGGTMLAMKGRFDAREETTGLPEGWHYQVIPVTVAGLSAARCLVRVCRQGTASGEDHG